MCDNHSHDDHTHEYTPHHGIPLDTDGGVDLTTDHPAVVHPDTYSGVYEGGYTYVRELAANRYDYWDIWEKLRDPDNRVIESSEIPFYASGERDSVEGAQMWNKWYMNPRMDHMQSLTMHCEILAPQGKSQDHYHQNEAYMYILEGEGYEIHDGEEYQWEAGDLVIIHGGCVHQHFSADRDNPCKALIVKPKALYQFLHLLYQGPVEAAPDEDGLDPEFVPDELYSDVMNDHYGEKGNIIDNREGHHE